MDTCPFCGTEIGRTVAVQGGHCPRCLNRIPGEDAPTEIGTVDPVATSPSTRGWVSVAVGLVAVGLTGVLGLWAASQSVAMPEMTSDVEAVDVPEVVGVAPASSPRPPATSSEAVQVAPRTSRGAALELSVDGPEATRATIRRSPQAREMIADRLRTAVPELQHCYTRRLKQDPGAGGRFRLVLAVTSGGGVESVRVNPLSRPDPALESCIARHVENRWAFDPIAQRTVVSRTLTFEPPTQ